MATAQTVTGTISPEEWLKQQQSGKAGALPQAVTATMSPEEWLKTQQPTTTATGVAGAATRGLAPVAGGALLGAGGGALVGGVGAVPGALAGAAAGGLATLVGDPVVDLVNSTFGTKWTRPTDAINDLLTRAGVALPQTEAERVVQATASGVGGAGGAIGLGKTLATAASPVTQAVGRSLAAQPGAQVAGGAAAGGAAQGVQEAGGSPLAATGAALAAGMAGARMATPSVRVQPSQASRDIVKAGEQFGVPVLTSDIRPPSTFPGRTAQQFGERTILGTAKTRGEQQQKRIEGVQKLLDEFGVDANALKDESLKPVTQSFLAKRGADLTKYTNLKKSVFEPLDTMGAVPMPKTTAAIDQEISRLSSITGSQPLIGKLEELKLTLEQNPGISAVEANRKVLGNWMDDAGLASVKTEADKTARTLYGPLKQDMGDFIKTNGEPRDFVKWEISNKRLAEMTGELSNNALSKALKDGKTSPEAISSLLFSQKPSDLRLLYKNLPPEGRANAQRAILSNAADKSRFASQDGVEQFSPERFNKYLKDNRAQLDVFFQGPDRATLDGFSRLLTATKRASEANVSTASGMQGVPFLMGSFLTDMLGGAGAAAASAVGIGGGARLYESPAVRNLLMQLGTKKPGSQEEQQIIKRLLATLQTGQPQKAASTSSQEQP